MATYEESWDDSQLLADGWYLFEVKKGFDKRTKDGSSAISILLERQGGNYESLFDMLTFSPKAGYMAKQKLIALGHLPPEHKGRFEVFGNDLVGKRVWCWIVAEEYMGQKRNKVGMKIPEDQAKNNVRFGYCSIADFGVASETEKNLDEAKFESGADGNVPF